MPASFYRAPFLPGSSVGECPVRKNKEITNIGHEKVQRRKKKWTCCVRDRAICICARDSTKSSRCGVRKLTLHIVLPVEATTVPVAGGAPRGYTLISLARREEARKHSRLQSWRDALTTRGERQGGEGGRFAARSRALQCFVAECTWPR